MTAIMRESARTRRGAGRSLREARLRRRADQARDDAGEPRVGRGLLLRRECGEERFRGACDVFERGQAIARAVDGPVELREDRGLLVQARTFARDIACHGAYL